MKRKVWNPTSRGTAYSDSPSPGRFVDRAKSALGLFAEAFKKHDTHEADIFTEADVQSRVEAWSKVLARK